jgi:hypothetical protein
VSLLSTFEIIQAERGRHVVLREGSAVLAVKEYLPLQLLQLQTESGIHANMDKQLWYSRCLSRARDCERSRRCQWGTLRGGAGGRGEGVGRAEPRSCGLWRAMVQSSPSPLSPTRRASSHSPRRPSSAWCAAATTSAWLHLCLFLFFLLPSATAATAITIAIIICDGDGDYPPLPLLDDSRFAETACQGPGPSHHAAIHDFSPALNAGPATLGRISRAAVQLRVQDDATRRAARARWQVANIFLLVFYASPLTSLATVLSRPPIPSSTQLSSPFPPSPPLFPPSCSLHSCQS